MIDSLDVPLSRVDLLQVLSWTRVHVPSLSDMFYTEELCLLIPAQRLCVRVHTASDQCCYICCGAPWDPEQMVVSFQRAVTAEESWKWEQSPDRKGRKSWGGDSIPALQRERPSLLPSTPNVTSTPPRLISTHA